MRKKKSAPKNPSRASAKASHPLLAQALEMHQKDQLTRAEIMYQQIIEDDPHNFDAWHLLGVLRLKQRNYAEGEIFIRRALEIKQEATAWNHLGNALQEQQQFSAALECYQQSLRLKPDYVTALNNMGNALRDQNQPQEAVLYYQKALAIKSDYVTALSNLGNALRDQNKIEEAMEYYHRAQHIDSTYDKAHWNEALALLVKGDFANGWKKYEYRWKQEGLSPSHHYVTRPMWHADIDLKGKSILVYAEQGLGDSLQFIRYLPLLAERGATIFFEVQAALKALLVDLPFLTGIYLPGEKLPDTDYQCPLLSLPLIFSTRIESIPAAIPYVYPDADKIAHWEKILSGSAKKIGIVWSGAASHKNDRNRSIPLIDFKNILNQSCAEFISLQKEFRVADEAVLANFPALRILGPQIRDFADTAAIISLLDLVITVDTSVAHLAGAIGKPTWLLLPYAPDWRWLLNRDDSPWYPTMRLFRQPEIGDWGNVLERIARELFQG